MEKQALFSKTVLSLALLSLPLWAVDFSALKKGSWTFDPAPIGHVYGYSQVPWTYDIFHGRFVRIGGCTGGYTNEVYSYRYDNAGLFTSTQILAPGVTDSNRPGAGCSRGICYDSKRHIVWGYGGIGSPPIPCSGRNWCLMGLDLSDNSWRMAPGSDGYRMGECCQIAYSPDHDAIMLVGQDGGSWHQTWLYEFSTSKWRRIGDVWSPTRPGAYFGVNLTYKPVGYDALNKVFVMLPADSQTWVFNPTTMTGWDIRRPAIQPSRRDCYGITYDTLRKKLILHGGRSGATALLDTWSYDASSNTWTLLDDSQGPRRAGGQSQLMPVTYDAAHDCIVAMCPNEERGLWIYRTGDPVASDREGAPVSVKAAAAILQVSPNPASGPAQCRFAPDRPGPVRLDLFTLNGQRVWSRSAAVTGNWGTLSLDAAWLPSGAYVLRLIQAGRRAAETVLVRP